jgi:hypothetical protein
MVVNDCVCVCEGGRVCVGAREKKKGERYRFRFVRFRPSPIDRSGRARWTVRIAPRQPPPRISHGNAHQNVVGGGCMQGEAGARGVREKWFKAALLALLALVCGPPLPVSPSLPPSARPPPPRSPAWWKCGRARQRSGRGGLGGRAWLVWARGVGEGEKKREGESDEKSTSGLPRGKHLIHFFLTCLEVASFVAQEGAAPEIHPHPHPHPPSTHTHTHTHTHARPRHFRARLPGDGGGQQGGPAGRALLGAPPRGGCRVRSPPRHPTVCRPVHLVAHSGDGDAARPGAADPGGGVVPPPGDGQGGGGRGGRGCPFRGSHLAARPG